MLAELHGEGLDLSSRPWPDTLEAEALPRLTVPALVVSAADSPGPLRLVADRLSDILPQAEHAQVPGGHLIDLRASRVLSYQDAHLGPPGRPSP